MVRDPLTLPRNTGGPPHPPRDRGTRCLAAGLSGILAAALLAGPAHAEPDEPIARSSPHAAPGVARPSSRFSWTRGEPKSARSPVGEIGWQGAASLGLILAACGAIALAARRFAPRPAAGGVQVVGRVNLSPRHSVYLLRVGGKVLLVGAGPQGPPSLISELDDVRERLPGTPAEEES